MLKLTSLLVMTALAATACSSSSDSPSVSDDNSTTPVDGGDETTDSGDDGSTGDETTDGGDDGSTVDALISGELTQMGIISVTEELEDQVVGLGASFYRFPEEIDSASIAGAIGVLNDQDSCSVSIDDSGSFLPTIDDPDLPTDFFSDIETLSAGEVITLSDGSGNTYGELQLGELFGLQVYATPTALSYPVPVPLVIDIPGDEFPALSGIEVPGTSALADFSLSTGDVLTASSAISWTAGSGENSHISLEATSDDSDVELDCVLVDDGAFTLSAATMAELDAELGSGWSLEVKEASRIVYVVRQSGSSVLVVARTSE